MLNEFFNTGTADTPGPDVISIRSLRFNTADSSYLLRTSWGTPTEQNVYTISFWVKQSAAASGNAKYLLSRGPLSGFGTLLFRHVGTLRWENAGGTRLNSGSKYFDNAAWMHIVLVESENNRSIYINGELIGQDANTGSLADGDFYIGIASNGVRPLDGYMADVHFIDGQALAAVDFAMLDSNGVWQPKEYTGSYGNNGFHLDFSDDTDVTTIGKDSSGNGNNFEAFNFSVAPGRENDALFDSPSHSGTDTGLGGEVTGNYATLDPLTLVNGGELSNGNLDAALTSSSSLDQRNLAQATMLTESGKWYFEVEPVSSTNNTPSRLIVGIAGKAFNTDDFRYGSVHYRPYIGEIREDNNSLATGLPSTNIGDIIGVAYDLDASTFSIYVNGTFVSTVSFTVSGPFRPFIINGDAAVQTINASVNFGQRAFTYTAPSGYKAMSTANLAATIEDGLTAMDVKTWIGTSNNLDITGLKFSPDVVWIKARDTVDFHCLFDTQRGINNSIFPNSGAAELELDNSLTSFNSDGWTLGTYGDAMNEASINYVGWAWDAGSSVQTNNDGTIQTQVRANTTSGVSIFTYTGNISNNQTLGHGLGAPPEIAIIKRRGGSASLWVVYTNVITGSDSYLSLNDVAPAAASVNFKPTNTTISINASASINGGSMFCWAFTPISGFSKFGVYSGNGIVDGPFVNTGFKPRWLMVKRTDTDSSWSIIDTQRDPGNIANKTLFANEEIVESTTDMQANFFSNGFQLQTDSINVNASGGTFLYMAFAEHPFKNARAN